MEKLKEWRQKVSTRVKSEKESEIIRIWQVWRLILTDKMSSIRDSFFPASGTEGNRRKLMNGFSWEIMKSFQIKKKISEEKKKKI